MNLKSLIILLTITLAVSSSAQADIKAKGADGPAAIDLAVDILIHNIDSDSIDCETDSSLLSKQILADPQNKKLLKLYSKVNKGKDAKSLLKLLGFSESLFKSAAELAVESLCGDDSIDDGEDGQDPENL